MWRFAAALAAVTVFPTVTADIYMHGPRGSNDRNCETNANRNNGNRLFDSQNNAAGGYACPRAKGGPERGDGNGVAAFTLGYNSRMYYYENSKVVVEWTNQHGCGRNSRVQCQVIIQYACEDTLDPYWAGTTTESWPRPPNGACPENPDRAPGGPAGQCFAQRTPEQGCHVAAPRDGIPSNSGDSATDTIPNNANAATPDSQGDRRYGMHESYAYYELYSHFERNKGLWTSDQYVRRRDMRGTRQNPDGNRRGLEIPEERDYYPWWQPSPWRDIAVLSNVIATNETNYCEFVQTESQNVKPRYFCESPTKESSNSWNQRTWPTTQGRCNQEAGSSWIRTPSFASLADDEANLDAWRPDCMETSYSRTNHLGNSEMSALQKANWDREIVPSTAANRYIWTTPSIDTLRPNNAEAYFASSLCSPEANDIEKAMENCVLRIRYNISTGDLDQWPEEMDGTPEMVDWRNNSQIGNQDNPNSPLEQDPYALLPGITTSPDSSFLSFAVNTNQYARTFQDRSYVFSIRKRPTSSSARDVALDQGAAPALHPTCDTVINLNLRGKRGNIVQTYPSVEYDFIPDQVCATCSDQVPCATNPGRNQKTYIHFQWVGSDYNPRRGCNNGEGGPPDPNDGVNTDQDNSRADRTNLAFMTTPFGEAINVLPDIYETFSVDGLEAYGDSQAEWPCTTPGGTTSTECLEAMYDLLWLRQGVNGEQGAQAFNGGRDCLTQNALDNINGENNRDNHPLNCAKLNMRATPYFDGGLVEMTNCGSTFAFFSTRNNNFSNRDQTGTLAITDSDGNSCAFDGQNLEGITDVRTLSLRQNDAYGPCEEPQEGEANNNGPQSCIPDDGIIIFIEGDTFTIEEADNDAVGDGNKKGCEEFIVFLDDSSVEERIGLAIGLLFAGIFAAWGGVYLYNRFKARNKGESRVERTWTKKPMARTGGGGVAESDMI